MPVAEAMFMRDASMLTSIFMQVLIFATLFVFIYILIKRVIINNLKKINDTLAQITKGDLNAVVDVRSNEEFASLSDDINSTVLKAISLPASWMMSHLLSPRSVASIIVFSK